MVRFLWLTFPLVVVFAGAIIIAQVIGRTQPSPFVTLFTTPDGAFCTPPCLFGIKPGRTTVRQAAAMLNTNPAFSELPAVSDPLWTTGAVRGQFYGNRVFFVFGVHADGRVKSVLIGTESSDSIFPSFNAPLPTVSFGNLVFYMGQPESMYRSPPEIMYTARGLAAFYIRDRIGAPDAYNILPKVETKISGIRLYDTETTRD